MEVEAGRGNLGHFSEALRFQAESKCTRSCDWPKSAKVLMRWWPTPVVLRQQIFVCGQAEKPGDVTVPT